jgi:DnaJ-class molecular chaperone
MALVEGEYEFTCSECNGEGSLQVLQGIYKPTGEPDFGWARCDDCHGEGTVCVDDKEAAERIELGHVPIRTPAS